MAKYKRPSSGCHSWSALAQGQALCRPARFSKSGPPPDRTARPSGVGWLVLCAAAGHPGILVGAVVSSVSASDFVVTGSWRARRARTDLCNHGILRVCSGACWSSSSVVFQPLTGRFPNGD